MTLLEFYGIVLFSIHNNKFIVFKFYLQKKKRRKYLVLSVNKFLPENSSIAFKLHFPINTESVYIESSW